MFDLHLTVHYAFVLFCFQLKQLQAAGGGCCGFNNCSTCFVVLFSVCLYYVGMYMHGKLLCVCACMLAYIVCMWGVCVCVRERERERESVCVHAHVHDRESV